MNLEDHAGDIVRKARAMSHVSANAAAAARLSKEDLAAFEASGLGGQRINFNVLAPLVGLDARKLERIANGWLPATKDTDQWRELRMITTAGEGMTVNCFLIWDAETRTAALFDTGMDAHPVLELIAAKQLTLQHVFITHSHWDHVDALPKLRRAFPDLQLHNSSKKAPAAQRNQPGRMIPLGGLQIASRETPGHADDGATYIISDWPNNAPQVAVVGDTIFAGSIGNGNGHWELAKQKVRDEILSLPRETLICPGHGPLTSVAEERANNPFFEF